MTISHEIRGERLKAHEKMRSEVRNSVKEAILRDGISREDIRIATITLISHEVKKQMKGVEVSELVRALVRDELTKLCGGNYIATTVKELVKHEAQKLAAEFIEKNIVVKISEATW